MKRAVRPLIVIVVAGLALATLSGRAWGGEHADHRIGFTLEIPKGWTGIPADTEGGWVVAKYINKRQHHWNDPDFGSMSLQPSLKVIAFVDEVINESDVDLDEDEDEDDRPRVIDPRRWYPRPRVYRDYREFMRRTYPHGHYIDKDEVIDVDGKKVEWVEIQTQGLSAPIRLRTWIFPIELGSVAVQIEVLGSGFDKMESEINRILRSFEEIEATEALELNPLSGKSDEKADLDELEPREREARRKEDERRTWERLSRALPSGWKAKKVSGIPIVSNVDSRHAKKVAANVKAVYSWLDRTFPEIGAGEYVRTPIVRICANQQERNVLTGRSAARRPQWRTFDTFGIQRWGPGNAITTYKGEGGARDYQWDYVNKRSLHVWFTDRDADTYYGLPAWLEYGIYELVGCARAKGSKVEFQENDFERFIASMAQEGGLASMKELMLMRREDFRGESGEETYRNIGQATTAARFFIDGPGAQKKDLRHILPTYIANLRDVLTELEAEDEAEYEEEKQKEESDEEEDDDPTTEEEEEEYFRQRREDRKAREKRILEETLHRTFEGWTDEQWADLEKLYLKSY